MNNHHDEFGILLLALLMLAAAVFSVPIARFLRLSAIVAYLAVGVLIGPFGLALFARPDTILGIAELGVVMLLFLIGLELEMSRLVALRRAIFGLGAAQLALTAAAIGGLVVAFGLADWRGAIVVGLALAMSATSITLKILEDRGHLAHTYGQRAFAILLFQDMSVVPLLALLPLIAPGAHDHGSLGDTVLSVAKISAAVAIVVVAGRYLLNPFFRLLAATGAREVMTAASLLVVLSAAALMQFVGMSMALGAFLAGVLLAGSSYRHELAADIEPFRGLLLALFFMGVGMMIDLNVVWANVVIVAAAAIVITVLKAGIVWLLFRATCSRGTDALRAGSVLTAAGEFSFVLFPLGVSIGALSASQGSLFSAIAAVTMMLGPPTAGLGETILRRFVRAPEREADSFDGVQGSVLLIGFGRFGQIASQYLLTEGVDVTAIDNDPEMIENAGRFGFKVYYGDGTRLDVLRAAGAGNAHIVAVCVDNSETADRIVDLLRMNFSGAKIYARSYDRRHTLKLLAKGVDYEMRETFESALAFGRKTLETLGLTAERVAEIDEFIRKRDRDRLAMQQAEDVYGDLDLLRTRPVQPEPLSVPQHAATPLNPEAQTIIGKKSAAEQPPT